MEYTTINMDDSSKGDLFYRSLKEVLIYVSRGGLTFFAPPGSDKLPPIHRWIVLSAGTRTNQSNGFA